MGYLDLLPILGRIKKTAGFIATRGMRTDTVFELEQSYVGTPQMASCVERMKADPDMGKLISSGYTSKDYDLDELEQCPRGSLGFTYARVMKALGFNPKFYPDMPLDTDEHYCIMRVRKTHDIHHCISGFGPYNGGELSVIALNAYQFGYPAHVLIDLMGMALSFMKAHENQQTFDLVGEGMNMAHRAKTLMGVKWEEGWDKPLDRWREELGILPFKDGPNSWYKSIPNLQL